MRQPRPHRRDRGREARVTRIEITRQEPFAAGQSFGTVGAYEKVVGRFHGELDPNRPLDAAIVDLDKAPRNARGMVEYAADFYILKPVDLTKGNGALVERTRQSRQQGHSPPFQLRRRQQRPHRPCSTPAPANGFLMRQGYTLLWNGWMNGLPAANNALRIELPIASNPSGPIVGTVWDEFLFNQTDAKQARLTYKATSTDQAQAKLLVRDHNDEEPAVIPADKWEFVDAQTVRLLPAGTPFRIGAIYQLIYKAANPPVTGIGFAATRDIVSFARYATADDAGTPNPLAAGGRPALARALSQGNSQSGRYLRDFIYSGFNEDAAHRIVFDGSIPTVASGRTFLNYRFSQVGRINPAGHGFMFFPGSEFPFAYENQTDPFTGKSDGILARCTASNTCPKIIHLNSGTEYWQAGQSLVTTDPLGQRDTTPPDNVRILVDELGRTSGRKPGDAQGRVRHALQSDRLSAAAACVARWSRSTAGSRTARPPRRAAIPASPTARWCPRSSSISPFQGSRWRRVPAIRNPASISAPTSTRASSARRSGRAQGSVPRPGAACRCRRQRNRRPRAAGISVPTGTAMGLSVRSEFGGGTGGLCYLDGAFLPFAKTKAEREATKDPRPSLAERYRDNADYAERVKAAAIALETTATSCRKTPSASPTAPRS